MELPITAQVFSAAQILAGGRVQMSDFQRPYAWQVEHVSRLIDDIEAARGEGGEGWHPCGTITATRLNDGEFRLADGQQRLTTITIALAILRDREADEEVKREIDTLIRTMSEDGATLRYRLNLHTVTNAVLARAVQEPGATLRARDVVSEGPLSEAEANIIDNRDWLIRRLSALEAEDRRRLARFIAHACYFVGIILPNESAARRVFQSANSTGRRPSWIDLLKADLLDHMPVSEVEPCRQIFEVVQHDLGEAGMGSLLRHIAFIGSRGSPGDDVKGALATCITLCGGPHGFIRREVQRKGALYRNLRQCAIGDDGVAAAVDRRLQYLSWLHQNDAWMAPALHWLSKPDVAIDASRQFFVLLERLAYSQQILSVDVRPRENRSLAIMAAIDRGTVLERGGPLELGRAEVADLRKALSDEGLGNRRLRMPLLLRLNGALEGDDRKRDTPIANSEHVRPKRPGAKSGWMDSFGETGRLKRRVNMLGNLTLLTPSDNSALANAEFQIKKPVYAASPFALSRALAEHESWTADDVVDRTRKLIEVLFRSWQIAQ